MTIQEDPEISETEKVTRFGCGALLAFGFLALKHGDEFWYAVLGRGSRW